MSGGNLNSRIILVSGIPCSGKTRYTLWLEREKESRRWDVENTHQVPSVQELRKMGPLVVLDWGFHTNDLPIVEARNKEGLEVWWFDGDRTAARQCFIERAINEGITGDLLQRYIKDFDDQIARIDEAWSKIQRVVGSRIIDVVRPDGNQMQESEIFELMFSMLSGGNK